MVDSSFFREGLNWYDGEIYDPAAKRWTNLPRMEIGINESIGGFRVALVSGGKQLLMVAPLSSGMSELLNIP